jgi:hypothetical protein
MEKQMMTYDAETLARDLYECRFPNRQWDDPTNPARTAYLCAAQRFLALPRCRPMLPASQFTPAIPPTPVLTDVEIGYNPEKKRVFADRCVAAANALSVLIWSDTAEGSAAWRAVWVHLEAKAALFRESAEPAKPEPPAPNDMTVCSMCGTWRRSPCGEGCYWGIKSNGQRDFSAAADRAEGRT